MQEKYIREVNKMAEFFIDLLDMAEGKFKDKKEALKFIESVVEDIRERDDDYMDEVRREAEDSNFCPTCIEDLVVTVEGEESFEFWGCPYKEPVKVLMCENCGKKYI